MSEKDAKVFAEILMKIMQYRNAVTHGRLVQEGEKTFLFYHRAKPQRDEINDEYWKKVEERFKHAHEILDSAVQKLEVRGKNIE